jgi:hypothetical protein
MAMEKSAGNTRLRGDGLLPEETRAAGRSVAFMEHDRDGEYGKLCIAQISMWQIYVNSLSHPKNCTPRYLKWY